MLTGLQVLTEVRDAPRTLRKAAPIAISAVTVLYVLANISYVSRERGSCRSVGASGDADRSSLLP
jgi:hypothetical protein